jgi:3D-(3,5/4)-trihydroxycyclohexane-1,2-dione acylhydrolase (decyclizing)
VFADPDVRFVNLNVAPVDAFKQSGLPLVADARLGLEALHGALDGWSADPAHTERARALAAEWDATVERAYTLGHGPLPAQSEVIGAVNRVSEPRDVVVCAAGSMPGDLHKLWRTRDPKGYHVEYGYSCMGYEIAGGLGVKMADPEREVFVLVGDGSYLMMAQELVTAVQEGVKLNVVLVQNHGFASIGALSESLGSQRFGTRYRARNPRTGALDGDLLPVDLAANAASLGADVRRATTIEELEAALREARASDRCTVIEVQTDPLVATPSSEAWWDVPVAEVAGLDSTRAARKTYEENKRSQRIHLTGSQAKTREEVTTP